MSKSNQPKPTTEYSDDQKRIMGLIQADDKIYYFDYEGFIGQKPSLAGLWLDSQFEQFTFEPILAPLAADLGVTYILWDEWVAKLHGLKLRGYLAVGYSPHEAESTPEMGQPEAWYRNAHWFLKRQVLWSKVTRPRTWTLDGVASHLGFKLKRYGTKQATQRLRYTLQFAERYGDIQHFTPTAKAKWTKLLNYNRQDVESLKYALEIGLRMNLSNRITQ